MKKYLSIFELFTRSTIYKIMVILLAMGVSQVALFYRAMAEWIPLEEYHLEFEAIDYYSLEWMVDRSKSAEIMAVAFILLTVVLCLNGCNFGSKSSYTLQRLQVTEKKIFLLQSLYNSLCYVLLLGAQVAVFLIQSKLYIDNAGTVTNQSVFLAFYRQDFMHSVLPLEGIVRWICNIVIVLCCGVSAAVFTYLQRRGKLAWSLLVVVACVILGFVQGLESQMAIFVALLLLPIAGWTAYWHVFQKKEGE